MTAEVGLGVLSQLLGSLTPSAEDLMWRDSPHDVSELHIDATKSVLVGIDGLTTPEAGQPYGVAVLGSAGVGKTHMLGSVRRELQEKGGFFFLVTLNSGKAFWPSTAIAIAEGFRRGSGSSGTQPRILFSRLGEELHLAQGVRDAIAGDSDLLPEHVETFIRALRTRYPEIDRASQQTARALVLLGAKGFEEQDLGSMYFLSDAVDEAASQKWGLPTTSREPQELVREASRLIAFTRSPSLIAFDQIDQLFAKYVTKLISPDAADESSDLQEVVSFTQGIVDLHTLTRRTLIVITCLPTTWVVISGVASQQFMTRLRQHKNLAEQIGDPELARRIISKRFAPALIANNPGTDNPTWPVSPEAFSGTEHLNPRDLIARVHSHLNKCLLAEEVSLLTDIMAGTTTPWQPIAGTQRPPDDVEQLDADYAGYVANADVTGALNETTEDDVLRELLAAGLAAWINEQPAGDFLCESPDGKSPALHAKLIQVLDAKTDRQATWSFRSISHSHHIAVISRVKKAVEKSGIGSGLADRHLFLLRRDEWPTGKRTEEVVDDAIVAGAVYVTEYESDLRVFAALQKMQRQNKPGLARWLTQRRPASATALLRGIVPVTAVTQSPTGSTNGRKANRPPSGSAPHPRGAASPVMLGRLIDSGGEFAFPLASLCRHMVIFAGSGSGKTVLIKRVVEECALRGVSAIVLDVNDDLARLGDAWPQQPASGWQLDDAARAVEFHTNTEIVVWTPRVNSGRPLSFRPLPDFSAVKDDPDEFALAVGSAVDALAPRVGAVGDAEKAKKRRAVLTKAMEAFAKSDQTGIASFKDYLANLPVGVSGIGAGQKIAAELADLLQAEMDIDPLLQGRDAIADPGVLVTPTNGRRARISVISFIGLTPEQRQSFVGQLELALFNWVKQHPMPPGTLGWLLVIDEAQNYAPATGVTPSTNSTILLAQQARKYGLGLILATQPPKGIHNQVVGNALTQFVGLLNAGAHIQAARELAEAKGAKLPDVGSLKRGQFYVANESESFARVDTPLCLSYHGSALTREEVIERAKRAP